MTVNGHRGGKRRPTDLLKEPAGNPIAPFEAPRE